MHFLINALVIALVAADNACNDADKKTIKGPLFPGYLWQCTYDAFLAPKTVIRKCLKKGCRLTDECAQCFGDFGKCGLNCTMQCLEKPSDPRCKKCMEEHNCNAPLLKCTGLIQIMPAPTAKSKQCK
ncbi:hypothetical protein FOZ61_006824 [Perkinsus olseni]|uniref:Uncharacterized protein n=1 Tax=Perkinsus olseni TaxID=32597 RepID=A0A7J6MX97_PEROL|nr:hypothetical protein FOZ61_006824 [Perkinsus olseni]KAF4676066.1 hypothetical protein FOL46_007944 [Perkinsus olseni]